MFTNTFKQYVIDQFETRSAINEKMGDSAINWINRTPFVFAYSNLRYGQSGSINLQENMKWSVLSSFHVTGSSDYTYGNYILQDNSSFYDLYENDTNFGIIPKPHIVSLDIRGRGNNGTLKEVNMQIICYSFDQFANIRRYFSVPCTSVFLQFGYFVSQQDIANSVLPPLVCGYNQLTKTDQRAQQSYINTSAYYKSMDEKKIVNADGIIGIVYGFDVSQQQGNIFKLRVSMMCKGNSEILNYIKPDLKLAFNDLPSTATAAEGTFESNNSEDVPIENNLTNYIRGLSQRIPSGKHSVILNSNGQRYVSFDWINYTIVYILRRTTTKAFVNQDSNRIPVDDIYEPLYYFDIQQDFDAEFYSNTPNVAILPRKNTVGYPFVYEAGSNARETLNSKIINLQTLYADVHRYIQGNSVYQSYIVQNRFSDKIEEYYNNKYSDLIDMSTKPYIGYLGHVYFNLESVLQLLKDQEKLTLDNFMSNLTDMITSATNRGLVCSTSFNHRTEKFAISQHSLAFLTAKSIHYLHNFGPGSIVKQITYNLKMPDGYKVAIFQAYGANGGVMKQLFDRMFNGELPQDIYLYKGVQGLTNASTGDNTKVDYTKQLDDNRATALTSISSNGKLNLTELAKDSVKKSIDLYNQALTLTKKQTIATETGHRSVSSIYSTQVEIVLDFIANIDWGEVFKLEYNPLGWETKFYVSDIQHRIQQGNAQTIIKGIMFG